MDMDMNINSSVSGPRPSLEAVIFDMDGLMIDSERFVALSWDKAGEEMGYGPLGFHMPNTLGMNRKRREAYFLEQYGPDFPFLQFLETYRRIYFEETQKNGLPLKPGLVSLLDYLKKHHIKAAVASSSSAEHVLGNLSKNHLEDYFQAVINGSMIRHSKPEPDIYLEACRQLQTAPCKAMALEDAPNGILSASRAGLYPVMVPDLVQPEENLKPHIFQICDSLEEIPALIEACFTIRQDQSILPEKQRNP